MKKLLLLLLLINGVTCLAQDVTGLRYKAKETKGMYIAKADVHKSKARIYADAKKWVADYFKEPRDMLINEAEAAGILYGRGFLFVKTDAAPYPYKMGVTMQIDCLNNQYKIRFYNILFITHTSTPKGGGMEFNVFTPTELAASLNSNGKIKNLSPKEANSLIRFHGKEVNLALQSFVKAMDAK